MLLLLVSTLALCSCRDAYSLNKTYEQIRKQYPKARIYHEGDSECTYWAIIDSDGTYLRVVTGSIFNPKITRVEKPIELR